MRNLPTSDLDFGDDSLTETIDLHDVFRSWRDDGPMRIVKLFGADAVILLSYEAVSDFLKDEATMPAAPGYVAGSGHSLGPFISTYEGHEHRVRRAILSPPFRRRIMPRYVELIGQTASELTTEMAPLGKAELVEGFTKRFPLRVISRMLGLPDGLDDMEMAKMALDLIRWDHDQEAALKAKSAYVEMVTPLLEERRLNPGDDLMSLVMHTDFEGYSLNDEEVQAFVRHLFPAGADTTLLGLGNVLIALLKDESLLKLAQDEPDKRNAIIEEAMRYEAPVANLPRMSPFESETEWGGITFAPATPVICSIMSANRDEAAFPDAHVLNPERPFNSTPLTFGLGSHFCVGNHLAMAEMRIGLDSILEAMPNIAAAPGHEPTVAGTILRGPSQLSVVFDAER